MCLWGKAHAQSILIRSLASRIPQSVTSGVSAEDPIPQKHSQVVNEFKATELHVLCCGCCCCFFFRLPSPSLPHTPICQCPRLFWALFSGHSRQCYRRSNLYTVILAPEFVGFWDHTPGVFPGSTQEPYIVLGD